MLQTRLATVLALPRLGRTLLLVLAPAALAVVAALHPALEALTILLETGGFLAIAPFIVSQQRFRLHHNGVDFGLKGRRVPIESGFNSQPSLFLVVLSVVAVHTVAAIAHQSRSEAVAVQLQTLGLLAVAAHAFALATDLTETRGARALGGTLVWLGSVGETGLCFVRQGNLHFEGIGGELDGGGRQRGEVEALHEPAFGLFCPLEFLFQVGRKRGQALPSGRRGVEPHR